MAFPATYNINYYMGDTHEFRVYPKDASGSVFPLSQYTSVNFTIAERRGNPLPDDQDPIQGYAAFSNDRTNVLCAITNATAASLDSSKQYVFDVQISKAGSPYDSILTLLTGNISITDQVTLSGVQSTTEIPGTVTGLNTTDVGDTSITLGWTAPTTGGLAQEYKTYLIPYDVAYDSPVGLQQLVAALPLATPTVVGEETATFTSTSAAASLGLESIPLQPSTAYIYAVVASNAAGDSAAVGNFDLETGVIDELTTTGDVS